MAQKPKAKPRTVDAYLAALSDDKRIIPGQVCKKELAGYASSGRGTIRFPPHEPLPATLVRKVVKALIAAKAA